MLEYFIEKKLPNLNQTKFRVEKQINKKTGQIMC